MSSILDQILREKQNEIKRLKHEEIPANSRRCLSIIKSIKQKGPIGIIAEIKRHSPSKGELNGNVNPIKQAKEYEKAGAAAISVLTDTPFFKGSFADIESIRKVVDIPILCKDFIVDPIQIYKAKSVGADAILLIVAALDQEQLQNLYCQAAVLGLEVLVEVHNEEELLRALAIGAIMIGINNRDLSSFEVSLQTTVKLAKQFDREEVLFISESGMANREDVKLVREAGVEGILVGETLMKANNIEKTMLELSLKEVSL